MTWRSAWVGLLAVVALPASAPAFAQSTSIFPQAPAEPRAVTVAAKGDGRADDTEALQQALDRAVGPTHHGLVFLPSGQYRITRTLIVPTGVRIYGVGPTRPEQQKISPWPTAGVGVTSTRLPAQVHRTCPLAGS